MVICKFYKTQYFLIIIQKKNIKKFVSSNFLVVNLVETTMFYGIKSKILGEFQGIFHYSLGDFSGQICKIRGFFLNFSWQPWHGVAQRRPRCKHLQQSVYRQFSTYKLATHQQKQDCFSQFIVETSSVLTHYMARTLETT